MESMEQKLINEALENINASRRDSFVRLAQATIVEISDRQKQISKILKEIEEKKVFLRGLTLESLEKNEVL